MTPFTKWLAAFASTALVSMPVLAIPIDFELYSDLRLTHASGEPTWFNDWFGKGRYGGRRDGSSRTDLRLSEVSLIAKADISWNWQAFAHAKYDPEQSKPADLVEAFVTFTPAPKSAFSYQVKAGLFFPHISRENIGVAWTTPFTITPSAVNSWVGEEIRTLGIELKGSYRSEEHKVDLTAAVFGFNDPAGTLLAFRGWGIGDAKVGAFSQVPLPPIPSIGLTSDFLTQPLWVHPVKEIDNRPGYYVALDYSFAKRFKAGAFYYDNRGDPEVIKDLQYGWDTRFWNYYAEAEVGDGFKLIGQYMTGRTEMGRRYGADQLRHVDVNFAAGYLLATKTFGRYRLTARHDWFDVDDNSFIFEDDNNEVGTSFTAAFSAKLGKKTTVLAEYLRIDSDRPFRTTIGFDAEQSNDIFQISLRQRF